MFGDEPGEDWGVDEDDVEVWRQFPEKQFDKSDRSDKTGDRSPDARLWGEHMLPVDRINCSP